MPVSRAHCELVLRLSLSVDSIRWQDALSELLCPTVRPLLKLHVELDRICDESGKPPFDTGDRRHQSFSRQMSLDLPQKRPVEEHRHSEAGELGEKKSSSMRVLCSAVPRHRMMIIVGGRKSAIPMVARRPRPESHVLPKEEHSGLEPSQAHFRTTSTSGKSILSAEPVGIICVRSGMGHELEYPTHG
jgi:hypothetical protein